MALRKFGAMTLLAPEEKRLRRLARQKRHYEQNKERYAALNKKWRENNKEAAAAYVKKWMQDNIEHRRVYHKKWRDANPDKVKVPYERKRAQRLKKFGLTLAQFNQMYASQEGLCGICEEPFKYYALGGPTKKEAVCVDHNHATGKVRGLLCSSCNLGIGHLKESKQFLLNAISYIEKHNGC